MSRVVVDGLSVSLDGYVAGLHQDEDNPLGVGGSRLHEWIFATKSGRQMIGESGGAEGVDEGFFHSGGDRASTTIMGRNMFGPVRGPWSEPEWRGWWGDVPPFHHPVFVLTHFERPPLEMEGGTTFYFATKGIPDALARAREVAGDGDIQWVVAR